MMTDYSILEMELYSTVRLTRRPVAVTFRPNPPKGVPKFAGSAPSGCSFFGIAAGGMTFYTVPSDHYQCAIGNYTYNLPLPEKHSERLERSVALLGSSCSVDISEIRSVPRTKDNPNVVIYGPLGDTTMEPDIVVLVVRPQQGMLLQEAAMRRHIGINMAPLGRPTCMSLHCVLDEKAVTSAGCMGNRVYNGLQDDEMYMLLPGRLLKRIADEVQLIATANTKLIEKYLEQRESIQAAVE